MSQLEYFLTKLLIERVKIQIVDDSAALVLNCKAKLLHHEHIKPLLIKFKIYHSLSSAVPVVPKLFRCADHLKYFSALQSVPLEQTLGITVLYYV